MIGTRAKRRVCFAAAAALAGACCAGCDGTTPDFMTEDRMRNGLVIILPGIEGESPMNHNIRHGLLSAGVNRAMPIHRWGSPIPIASLLVNQVNFIGNRLAGAKVAKMIVAYQDTHPGKPVHVIGHSGGGGVAVFAAEAMPEGRKVDGLILLSASISNGYDLTKALGKCTSGVLNFFSKADVGLLMVGTTIVGNVDGMHGPSAGLTGFTTPGGGAPSAKRQAYSNLYQVQFTSDMTGGGDAHSGSTNPAFVRRYVTSWVTSASWPAGSVASGRPDNSAAPTGGELSAAGRK